MAKVFPGRYSAEMNEETVVFIIGMRINKLWKFWKWLPVAFAMPRMLAKLAQHKELGLLHVMNSFAGRTSFNIQYWKSFDHLHRFAHDKDMPHLEPWREYMKKVGSSGDVGVFHETYRVRPGDYECIYTNHAGDGPRCSHGARSGGQAWRRRRRSTRRQTLGSTQIAARC